MRSSRGMGCMKKEKLPGYKKGGVALDRLIKRKKGEGKIGKKSETNLKNLGKY